MPAWLAWCLVLPAVGGGTTSSDARYYTKLDFHELVARAERVVAGSIVELGEETFRFDVERVLFGEAPRVLEVARFQDWVCASRWSEYEVGQRLLLFLEGNGAIGGGNEGEMPLVREGVLLPYFVEGSSLGSRWAAEEFRGSWIDLDSLEDAIADLRQAFDFAFDERGRLCAGRRASNEELARARSRSSVARTLFDDLARYLGEAPLHAGADGPGLVVSGVFDELLRDYEIGHDADLGPPSLAERISLVARGPDRGPLLHLWGRPSFVVPLESAPGRVAALQVRGYGPQAVERELPFGRQVVYSGMVKGLTFKRIRTHPEALDGVVIGRDLVRLGDLDGSGVPETAG